MNEEHMTYLPVEQIYSHPDNPRKNIGDVTELAESIRANGILQNLTVVPGRILVDDELNKRYVSDGYTAIIGHRRLAAAKLAGLETVPCVIREMSASEQVKTMLMENIQRSDLTVYEQAQGFQMMIDLGSTVEQVAAGSGFSVTTVRKRIKMMELDQELLRDVSSNRQITIFDVERLAQIEDIDSRNECLKSIGTSNFNQELEHQIRRQSIEKNLPAIKEILRVSKAKKIQYSETWSGKYSQLGNTVNIADWTDETRLISDGETRKLFYYLDESNGRVSIYVESPKPKPVKRSEAEIAREKRIQETWEKLEELHKVVHKLRSDFIDGLTLHSKNRDAMLKGAILACGIHVVTWSSTSATRLYQKMGFDTSSYDAGRSAEAIDMLKNAEPGVVPLAIYSAFGDADSNRYSTTHRREFPTYEKNFKLDALYDWLMALGYSMSDDEIALQNGTHELLNMGGDKE